MDKQRKTSNLINIIDYDEDGNILLGENGISAGFFKFDTTPTDIPELQGAMFWDEDDNTVDVILNGYRMKIGEDTFYPVKNQSGSTITKGTNVKFAGTVGASGRLLILPFLANGTDPSYVYMGVAAEDIADGEDGKVLWFGRLRGLNTNAFEEGDILYASTTVSGGFQTAIPTGANNIVQVSAVITKSINQGVIFIRPQIEPLLFKPENVANKSINLTSPDDVKYPTTLAVSTALSGKQDTLVSATNIKTINGNSVLGSGDLVVSGSNIYNADGTLTSARTVTSGGFPLTFTGSNIAAAAIARGLNLTHTLVAAATNDVLIGLDVNPTFTNGIFGNVKQVALRVNGQYTNVNTNNFTNSPISLRTIGDNDFGISIYKASFGHTNSIQFLSNNTNSRFSVGQGFIGTPNSTDFNIGRFASSAWSNAFTIFNSTGNISINSSTDAGFRLDVNGTARVSGVLTFANASTGVSDLYIGLSDVSPFTGNRNIIIGNTSGTVFSTGIRNVILGMATITNTSSSTVQIGNGTTTTGSNSISIGSTTSCSANSIAIGLLSRVTGANSINISTGLFSVTRMAIANDICFAIGSSYRAETTANNQGILNAQNVFIGRPARSTSTLSDSGNGIATSINGMGGYALTNATGGNLTIAGGVGLGTGTSGDVIFSTATPTTSGTTLQTLTERVKVFGNTGNVLIQNGGTFTDAGFKLDVNGTARVQGQTLTLSSTAPYILFTTSGNLGIIGDAPSLIGGASAGFGIRSNTAITFGNGQRSFAVITNNGLVLADESIVAAARTKDASAVVDIQSTTRGFLPPRMTNAQRLAIASPAVGLMVYCTDVVEGLYVNKSTGWTFVI